MADYGIGVPKQKPLMTGPREKSTVEKGAEAVDSVFRGATEAVKKGATAVKETVDKYTGKNQKWVDPQKKSIDRIFEE